MSEQDRKTQAQPVTDLRYGDLCPRCNAASGIDACPVLEGHCPLDADVLPVNYYEPRRK